MFDAVEDVLVKWERYVDEEQIFSKFPTEQWQHIAGDIQSDAEWADFVGRYINSVKCWVLKIRATNLPIAFIYIFNEDGMWKSVSIHGGGWGSPLMYYRGFILILKHFLGHGLKVRTYCKLSNPRAIRFVRGVGFWPYRYTEDEVFMWISEKKLKNSMLYKYFYD